jgi:hypothetical protein
MPFHNAHAAKVNEDGIVEQVIVIPFMNDNDAEVTAYVNSIGLPGKWLDTSYMGSRRGKYAGVGDRYDAELDEFVSPVVEAPADAPKAKK